MSLVRRALATAAFTAIAVAPAAHASAAGDTPDLVRELATDGAQLVAEESELLQLDASGGVAPTDLAEARSKLRTVDARGSEVMQQLDLLGVDLSNAIREALAPLPQPGTS